MEGQKIAHYRIEEKLGEGGMGEVYLARDTRLNRDVALKILPQLFAQDAQRMGRFEREAQVLASLNHPNIAQIYGFEEEDGTKALAMELVEGEDLSKRLARGPIPQEEALPLALQIAEGLEYAHEKGIIHRDLKPANIKLTPQGQVKILDFGLAKALEDERTPEEVSNSPTLSMQATEAGMILGTAAYMSPEQARGQTTDRRADIWSFGVILYEILTGQRLFQGDSVTDILAAVMKDEPDFTELPSETPSSVRRLLERCLRKDSNRRLRDIGDARLVLEDLLAGVSDFEPVEQEPDRSRSFLPWVSLAFLVGVMMGVWFALDWRSAPAASLQLRFQIALPEEISDSWTRPVISPDGKRVVVSADREGVRGLWVRRMDSEIFQLLDDTEGAENPFWSPDSRHIGFSAEARLRRIPAQGGLPAQTLVNAQVGSASWAEGHILYASTTDRMLHLVPEDGGTPRRVTTLDLERGEVAHDYPYFLPDGEHFLYGISGPGWLGFHVGSIRSDLKAFLRDEWSNAAYCEPGYLLYMDSGTLTAQAFELSDLTLTGEPRPLVSDVLTYAGVYGFFSVSREGMLLYRQAADESRLVWQNREGVVQDILGSPGHYNQLSLSPDGNRLLVDLEDGIGVFNLQTGVFSPVTRSGVDPVWSPDGRQFAFALAQEGNVIQPFLQDFDSGESRRLVQTSYNVWPESWSPDGQKVVFVDLQGKRLLAADTSATETQTPETLLENPYTKDEFQISPDGKWVAYGSMESGNWEIYVASFPDFFQVRQISRGGGAQPLWREDGQEIFYLRMDGTIMSVELEPNRPVPTESPKTLFRTNLQMVNPIWNQYWVTADGESFVSFVREDTDQISGMSGWQESLGLVE